LPSEVGGAAYLATTYRAEEATRKQAQIAIAHFTRSAEQAPAVQGRTYLIREADFLRKAWDETLLDSLATIGFQMLSGASSKLFTTWCRQLQNLVFNINDR
jgi:hypothetical protein